MIYIMSDLHGCYDKYLKMMEQIKSQDDDILYVLGDVVDRGPDGVKILLDMMNRKNVIMLRGNHDDKIIVTGHTPTGLIEKAYNRSSSCTHFLHKERGTTGILH